MEIITESYFCNPLFHEIKKMSMLKRQVWMADDDFDHIVKNSQRLLRLDNQYENHPYVE